MENNENNNVVNAPVSPKKNKTAMVVVILVIILAIVALVASKKPNNAVPVEPDASLNQAVQDDTTTSINDNLNKIDLNDTTDTDLNSVDTELQKL